MFHNKVLSLGLIFLAANLLVGCSDDLLSAVQEDVERVLNKDAPIGSIIIDSGATYTTSVNVSLALSASSPGGGTVTFMEISNSLSFTGVWIPYSTSLPWTLTSGDGIKNVYVRFRDDSDNISDPGTPIMDSIILDTTPPTGTVIIAGGAAYTQSPSVMLTLSATDTNGTVTDMEVRNDNSSFTGVWQSYATSLAWTLSAGDGTKNVYVRYRDNSGFVSNITITDSIVLDTTAPTGTVTIAGGAAYIQSSSVTLGLSATDTNGTVTDMEVRNDNSSFTGAWQSYATSLAWTLSTGDGTKNVYVRYRDNSGQISSVTITDSIILDTTPPTGTVTIAGGAAYTQSASVTLTLSASDASGTVTHMEVRNDTGFTGNWQAYATSLPWTMATGDGAKNVYVRYRDNSGIISNATITDSIILDTINPTISSRTPSSGASNQSRTVNAVVNFSENMNQVTMTTSTVYLRIKGGATVPTTMTKTATSVTLDPVANLLYGYDYQIVWTAGIQDLSGRSVTASTSDFTVERDYWEGLDDNDYPVRARDITGLNPYGNLAMFKWFDFVPTIQEEDWSLPAGVHSKLAQLESTDYYILSVPEDVFELELKVFFTSDEVNGTILDTANGDRLKLTVNHDGFGQGPIETGSSADNYLYYTYAISEPGEYLIMIQEFTYDYTNRRSYNLQYFYGDGY